MVEYSYECPSCGAVNDQDRINYAMTCPECGHRANSQHFKKVTDQKD